MRAVALYLPQFYPIPENDRWWGRGFTEWTNIARARPRFRGHEQPHLPADLGFYDLRVPEARVAQAELAAAHGIHGFCYYHYWSDAKRLLERPLEEVLRSGEPDFPFALCWANHDWTRGWDARSGDVLFEQSYPAEDDIRHLRWLAEHVWSDDRYITVNGRPLFLVRSELPDARATTDRWRSEAQRLGVPDPYLVARANLHGGLDDPVAQGFDASAEFPPLGFPRGPRAGWRGRIENRVPNRLRPALRKGLDRLPGTADEIYDYAELVAHAIRRPRAPWKRYPGVTPRWDNSPRRVNGALIFKGSTPALYRTWLVHVARTFAPYGPDEDLVFINAWNEWAEGAHLEPCQRWGLQYLEAHLALPPSTSI